MHEARVGFAIKTGLVDKLSGLLNDTDLFMTLKLPLSGNQYATIISACAITMTIQMKSKLSSTMIWIMLFLHHPSYKLIILGDLNARVGTDYQAYDGFIGSVGIGNCNGNGLLLQ